MARRVNSGLVAAYLLLCIMAGGSAQGLWANLSLQLLGVALIAWVAIAPRSSRDGSEGALPVHLFLLGGLIVILLQLIPLPANVWSTLPGRGTVAQAYRTLGYDLPALPIALAPYAAVATLLAVLPPVAAYLATEKLRPNPRWLAIAVIAGMALGVALGALQVGGGRSSRAYLYEFTNTGAVGFFANQNHMATLLLVSIPFAAAILASSKADRRASTMGRYGLAAAFLVLVLVGIVLNGSLAAFGLAVPVLLASFSLLPAALRWRRLVLPVAIVAIIGGIALLTTTPIASDVEEAGLSTSVESRTSIWQRTGQAVVDNFPVGTGLGSFEPVYRQYEDPHSVTREYVNHAHNDYLELALELGAPGMILIALFLLWWAVTGVRVWTSTLSTPFARAATIASGAILAHSIVDFPLRTAAIAAIFGASIALMAQRMQPADAVGKRSRKQSRHVKLG